MPKKIATRKSTIHGNGMFAVAAIAKGERLIEYKGQRRTHDEVVRFRDAWHRERETGGGVQFGAFPDAWPDTLPAPELPNVRLRTRG